MRLAYSTGVGQYRTAEKHVVIRERMAKRDGTRRGIIYCHGNGKTAASNLFPADTVTDKLTTLAAAGYPVICADLDVNRDGSNWGNDDHIDAIGDAWAYLKTKFGAKTDKVGIYGVSMGATGALNWVRQNLASVFAVALALPVLDLNDAYVNNTTGGSQAGIGTAYSVTYPTELPTLSTHSPVDYGAADLAGIPIGIWAASDDTTASSYADCQAWDGKGATVELVNLGAVGHVSTSVDPWQVLSFLDANGGRS